MEQNGTVRTSTVWNGTVHKPEQRGTTTDQNEARGTNMKHAKIKRNINGAKTKHKRYQTEHKRNRMCLIIFELSSETTSIDTKGCNLTDLK